jgi:hypothetical protein
MIWLTLREYRAQIVVMSVTTVLLAIGLLVMGSYAVDQRAALGVDTCVPLPNTNMNCAELDFEWRQRIGFAPALVVGVLFAPALAASYIGGPLFGATFERGTHRLAFTQAISRVRWSATRISAVLAITFACALLLAQFGWADTALNGLPGIRDAFYAFDVDGPPVVGYGLFAIAVGGLIGALSRRALTGMFLGLLVFGGGRWLVAAELRPNYEPPLVAYGVAYGNAMTAGTLAAPPKAWVLSQATVDAQDRPIDNREVDRLMQGYSQSVRAGGPTDMGSYLATFGVRQRIVYQPAQRYTKFQWIEFGLFTGLAAGCALLTIVLIRRRDA